MNQKSKKISDIQNYLRKPFREIFSAHGSVENTLQKFFLAEKSSKADTFRRKISHIINGKPAKHFNDKEKNVLLEIFSGDDQQNIREWIKKFSQSYQETIDTSGNLFVSLIKESYSPKSREDLLEFSRFQRLISKTKSSGNLSSEYQIPAVAFFIVIANLDLPNSRLIQDSISSNDKFSNSKWLFNHLQETEESEIELTERLLIGDLKINKKEWQKMYELLCGDGPYFEVIKAVRENNLLWSASSEHKTTFVSVHFRDISIGITFDF